MQKTITGALLLFLTYTLVACKPNPQVTVSDSTIVRISEIQIIPEKLNAYRDILKQEAEASVKVEDGVIAIFPMGQKNKPTEIRIVEIYASKEAYEMHLQSPHFKHYKTATAKMITNLKLVDMEPLNTNTMSAIFKKIN